MHVLAVSKPGYDQLTLHIRIGSLDMTNALWKLGHGPSNPASSLLQTWEQ